MSVRKNQIDLLLNPTEECKLAADLTQTVATKTGEMKRTVCLALISSKTIQEFAVFLFEVLPDEDDSEDDSDDSDNSDEDNNNNNSDENDQSDSNNNSNSATNKFEGSDLKVLGVFAIRHDFGMKIIGEQNFNIFFKENDVLYKFEAAAASVMWTVVSVLTRAGKIAKEKYQERENMGLRPLDETETHAWLQSYFEKFELKSEPGVEFINPLFNMSKATGPFPSAMPDPIKITLIAPPAMTSGPGGANAAGVGSAIGSGSAIHKQVVKPAALGTQSVRETWIKKQLKQRENEFTELRKITAVVGTWNVNEKNPKDTSFSDWLHLNEFEADVYAIGLQEIDMSTGAMLKVETEMGVVWSEAFERTFTQTTNKYTLLAAKQLVGLFHVVYAKTELMPFIQDIRIDAQKVGMMGLTGNKGGISVRFKLFESTFCFVVAHLAAHQNEVAKRNQNFHEICRKTTFGTDSSDYSPLAHDFFFWCGDLNYRINLEDAEVRKRIKEESWDYLLRFDQLTIEKKGGRVFEGFKEGKIDFPPTYKFDPGTNIYDTSEKKRVPSWTDRILWKADRVTQLFYTRDPNLMMSDHKPVAAGFDVEAKVVIESKYKALHMELIKMIDRMENEMLPECKLDQNQFVFDDVRVGLPLTKSLILENTGQVPAEFSFVAKPNESMCCKPWLRIEPIAGIIVPKERAEIKFTVSVDAATAPALNNNEDTLDDILILHLKHGRDHFVSISGTFLKSCFGNSLEKLCKIHQPIRSLPVEQPTNGRRKQQQQQQPQQQVPALPQLKLPKELWRLVDYIYKYGMREDGLFQEGGDVNEVDTIREKLDTGESFADYNGSIHSVAEALLRFLESLAEPVVPSSLYRRCIESGNNVFAAKEIVQLFPPVHFNTFHYLMAFLRELLLNADANSLTPELLAVAFASVLIRLPPNEANEHDEQCAASFVLHFLKPSADWARTTDDLLVDT